jgi:hypothetical protein
MTWFFNNKCDKLHGMNNIKKKSKQYTITQVQYTQRYNTCCVLVN